MTRQHGCGGARVDLSFIRASVRLWEEPHVDLESHGFGRPKDGAQRVQISVEAGVMLACAVDFIANRAALCASRIVRLNSGES